MAYPLRVYAAQERKYSCITFSDAIELGNLCSDGSWFIEGYPDWDNPEVTAWMPLPEPYRKEEKG